jgi:two-component system, OmpR family, sensor histidine kinase BaeS
MKAQQVRADAVERGERHLLADLAHEIRTPLACLEVCVESLEDGAMEPGPHAWEILEAQIRRLSRLADELGLVSAAEEGRLSLAVEAVDPRALVDDAVACAWDSYARKQVALEVSLGTPGPLVTLDPPRIEQVLTHLLSNALTHTPPGGRVTITLETAEHGISLRVADTGDGIPAEHLPHIFEHFYRTDAARDRARGGTGLGLAISRALAQAHGGRLTAWSEGPGRGTVMTLWLPLTGH